MSEMENKGALWQSFSDKGRQILRLGVRWLIALTAVVLVYRHYTLTAHGKCGRCGYRGYLCPPHG